MLTPTPSARVGPLRVHRTASEVVRILARSTPLTIVTYVFRGVVDILVVGVVALVVGIAHQWGAVRMQTSTPMRIASGALVVLNLGVIVFAIVHGPLLLAAVGAAALVGIPLATGWGDSTVHAGSVSVEPAADALVSVFNSMDRAAIVIDADGRVVSINDHAAERLSIDRGALLCPRVTCGCPLHGALHMLQTGQNVVPPVFDLPGIGPVMPRAFSRGWSGALLVAECPSSSALASGIATADLAAMLSHELRSPLATLRMTSELAMDDGVDVHDQQLMMQMMARQVGRLDALTSDLLETFALRAGSLHLRREPSNVREVCETAIADVELQRGPREVTLTLIGSIPEVCLDTGKLRTVIRNLVANALKHTSAAAPVDVMVSFMDDHLRIVVADSGQGIAAGYLPYLFDPYYRVTPGAGEEKPAGSGLGLFIVRTLAEAQGGRVHVESELGRGTCFIVTIPVERVLQPGLANADTAYEDRLTAV